MMDGEVAAGDVDKPQGCADSALRYTASAN